MLPTFMRNYKMHEGTAEYCAIESDGGSRFHSCKIARHARLRSLLLCTMYDDKKEMYDVPSTGASVDGLIDTMRHIRYMLLI